MDPQVAAHRLNEIALLLEVRGENPFKSRAFASAARTLQGLEEDDIAPLVRSRAIADLPGIGSTTLAVLSDLVESGDSAYLEALRATTPEGLVEMLRISGLGPTRIHRLHSELGLESVADLEVAAADGRLAALSGFGLKTAAKILRGIAALRETSGQLRHNVAATEGLRLRKAITKLPGVTRAEIAGSLRRSMEVVRDIDLVAACAETTASTTSAVTKVPGVQEVEGTGPSLTLRMINGVRADLHCVPEASFPVALWRATGSKEHCESVVERLRHRGFTIRDDQLVDDAGKVVHVADEETVYRAAGLAFIPLELRENRGEIEAAEAGTLPDLVRFEDLRGALHCHSNYSDGATPISQMARAAQERGWSYLGISDHSRAAQYAGGMDRDAVLRQHDEIDALNQKLTGFRVLKGIEADILADGTLDFASDDVLDRFEYVIGSVHSRFSMGGAQMTERILKAMSDPRLTILGHPTGRLLLSREPYPIDMDAVVELAAETGVALELNCDPHRLDLDWRTLQVARKRGVTIEVGPDAHSPDELGYLDFGIFIARKGWLEKSDVLNARSADDVLNFARARRESPSGGTTRGA